MPAKWRATDRIACVNCDNSIAF